MQLHGTVVAAVVALIVDTPHVSAMAFCCHAVVARLVRAGKFDVAVD